ncbi:MAG: acyltransferase, partial [Kofleriaceae bacterium]|nr:acyltransferase [Kofleriaceae bacterium]
MASILPTSPSMSHLSPASNEMPKASITQEIIPATERAHWTRYLPALDGVRAVAILLVMAHNFNLLENTKSVTGKANELLFNLGWVGVQLFFVLSGFLITNILLSTKGSSNYFASFFGRRALRIFPLYYLALAGGLIVYPLLSGTSIEGAENQVWLWSYLSNWAAPMGQEVGLYPHMWSLAVEEQFYLLWPFLVYFLSRRGLMRVCLALTAIALVSRIGIRVMDMSPEAAYQFTICRIDAIALGGVAAMLFRDLNIVSLFAQKRTLIRITLVVAAVLTFVVTKGAPRIGLLSQTIGYSLWAIIAAIWVYDVATSDPRGKLVRALSWQP